ncbi:hypothetical protein [Spirosoma aerolatum]|uniref:hypothetical protein n=1 Tax=Spirosoma aerolatum TaxID=1211326 RepID=UPI001FEC018D|nr:hypothetical protein [Spirosoma aerolatum]
MLYPLGGCRHVPTGVPQSEAATGQTAIYCTKLFQIEIDRQSQSALTIFTGQKQHGDEVVRKAQDYTESNLQEKYP